MVEKMKAYQIYLFACVLMTFVLSAMVGLILLDIRPRTKPAALTTHEITEKTAFLTDLFFADMIMNGLAASASQAHHLYSVCGGMKSMTASVISQNNVAK